MESPVRDLDPSLERAKIENEKFKDEWTTCCSRTDKHFLRFIIQVLMGFAVIMFSMVQITVGADKSEVYFSMLSGTLAYFLPAPSIEGGSR
jgi:hypothetical protein